MRHVLKILVPAALVALGLTIGSAQAIVPPKDCGRLTAAHKHWRIKADQISCKRARSYAKAYIVHHTRPRGYTCHRYKSSETSLYAKCVNRRANPDRTVFIIRQ
jgi:hypothetical protein